MGKIDKSCVATLDVQRYMGKWYEIARFENSFERGMTQVTATYRLLPGGKIEVRNEGLTQGGRHKVSMGRAKQPHPDTAPGELRVSFFLWFYSNYNIMELGDDYSYAAVGGNSDRYLWILSRTPTLPDATLRHLIKRLRLRGYSTQELVYIDQAQ